MIEGVIFEPTPVFFVVIGLVTGVVLGWVIGFFDSNNRSAKKIEVAEARAERALSEAEQKIASMQASEGVHGMDDPGLLRLTHKDNAPHLEMDGKVLSVKSVSPEQKKRLIELLTYIRPWVEGGRPVPVVKPAAPASPSPASVPAQPVMSSLGPASTQPLSSVKPAEEKNIRSLSIVAQIDSVLQVRLIDTPLANKGIRLTESALGGVEVYVGLSKYPSIDDVPDIAIINAIRSAIAEWEQKFTPGS